MQIFAKLVAVGCFGVVAPIVPLDNCQAATPEPASTVDYNSQIRPLLTRHCYACHGPDSEHRQAGLRFDERSAAVGKLDSGDFAIVPGQPDVSELIRRITAGDDEVRMPPKANGEKLNPEEVDILRRWIEQGAKFDEHWSFVKPQRPKLPIISHPQWPQVKLDYHIRAAQQRRSLEFSPEADRYSILRRLSLDIRGLPPTPGEVSVYSQDDQPDAIDRLLDRLLADPAYGERWARVWLDLARYADSRGYGSDPLRMNMWRYRDWVIDAFNRNISFDQFTVEQVAGDLIPGATVEQKIATAFHRNTMTNTEGGTDDEEFRTLAVKDRIDTTMQVWMGLTMGCAKCHNHKYDPISQREYYQFYAIFNQTADADRPDDSPFIPVPSSLMVEEIARLDESIAALRRQADTSTSELQAQQREWESTLKLSEGWSPFELIQFHSKSGVKAVPQSDGSLKIEGEQAANDVYTISVRSDIPGISAIRLETVPDPTLPAGGAGRGPDGNFVLSRFSVAIQPASSTDKAQSARFVRVELPGSDRYLSLAEVQVLSNGENVGPRGQASQKSTDYGGEARLAIDGKTDGDFQKSRSTTHTRLESDPWWEVDLQDVLPVEQIEIWNRTDGNVGGRLANFRVLLLDQNRNELWRREIAEPPAPRASVRVGGPQSIEFADAQADFSQEKFSVANALRQADPMASGWGVGPHVAKSHAAVFSVREALGGTSGTTLRIRLEHSFKQPNYTLGRFRLSVTRDAAAIRRLQVPSHVLAVVDTAEAQRSESQQLELARYYRSIAPSLASVRDQISGLEKRKPAIPTVPVMEELPVEKRRLTAIMVKGDFLTKGEPVRPALPQQFHTAPGDDPPSRLEVAQWLIDFSNPLTARVAANRIWSQLFGAGLVETEEDFGSQGTPPTHPEVLDELAVEFQTGKSAETAWNTKRLIRGICLSATYRQVAIASSDDIGSDPRNIWYARGPRFRLEAEMVRDQALALSGLLSRKVHGPSVYPHQPNGLWRAAFNGERNWSTSSGEDKFRRGLYTFWRRTVPYPSMATFDAPSREACAIRRLRTNTPLQAFVTLNDPVYVEAAQGLARRILSEGGTSPEGRAAYGLSVCLGRPATTGQIEFLVRLYSTELNGYRLDPDAALQMATDPIGPVPPGISTDEAAAWTVVANVLLNLDGVLTK